MHVRIARETSPFLCIFWPHASHIDCLDPQSLLVPEYLSGTCKVAQWVNTLATKPELTWKKERITSHKLISDIHMLPSTQAWHIYTDTHTHNVIFSFAIHASVN